MKTESGAGVQPNRVGIFSRRTFQERALHSQEELNDYAITRSRPTFTDSHNWNV